VIPEPSRLPPHVFSPQPGESVKGAARGVKEHLLAEGSALFPKAESIYFLLDYSK